jgi:hypothetical protein
VNAIRIVLVVVDAAVGLTAIGGGIALAAGLEGERYPVEWLTGTPFSSYLIPGLILSVAVAVAGSAAAAAAHRKPPGNRRQGPHQPVDRPRLRDDL